VLFRHYRGHLIRKADIYNRDAVRPETLEWVKEFKVIQQEKYRERQQKVDSRTEE
jgi:hypothetical protein